MNRNFWLLTGGQAVSMLGSGFGQIAMAWLVYDLTGSKLAMGTLFLLTMVPETLLRLLGAPLVDRFNRLYLLRAMDLIQMVLYAVPPLIALTGQLQLWHLYAFAVVAGLTRALHAPAYFALVPNIVPKESLVRANSFAQSLTTGINMLGPILAGVLVATVGAMPALIIDSASYGLSALAMIILPAALGDVERQANTGAGYLTQLTDGIKFYRTAPALLTVMMAVAASNFATSATNNMMVPFVREQLNGGADAVGWITSAMTGGVLLGGLLIGWLGEPKRRRIGLLLPGIVGGVAVVSLSLLGEGQVLPAMLLIGLNGLQIGYFNPQNSALYQRMVPDNLRGRVMAVRLTLAWGIMPFASFLGSLVAEQTSLPTMHLTFGLVPLAVGLIFLRSRSLQALEPGAEASPERPPAAAKVPA